MIPTVEALAYAMYLRNAGSYVDEHSVALEKLWNDDPDLRVFWMAEAAFVMEFLDVE